MNSVKQILFVGRLVARKGVDVLLRALPLIDADTPVHLHVVGKGDMAERWQALARSLGIAHRTLRGGREAATDQVLYNLSRRGIEWVLLPWCRELGLSIMAYSPIEQGRLLEHPVLQEVAARHNASAAQVALAWVLRYSDVIAIPRAGSPAHVEENRAAVELRLSGPDLAALERAFPPPRGPQPIEMI